MKNKLIVLGCKHHKRPLNNVKKKIKIIKKYYYDTKKNKAYYSTDTSDLLTLIRKDNISKFSNFYFSLDKKYAKNLSSIFNRKKELVRINSLLNNKIRSFVKKLISKLLKPNLVMIVNVICIFLNSSSFEVIINLLKIVEINL